MSTDKIWRVLGHGVAIVTLSSALAACGGSSDAGSASTASPASTASSASAPATVALDDHYHRHHGSSSSSSGVTTRNFSSSSSSGGTTSSSGGPSSSSSSSSSSGGVSTAGGSATATRSAQAAALLDYITGLAGQSRHILVGQHSNYWDTNPLDVLSGPGSTVVGTGAAPAILGLSFNNLYGNSAGSASQSAATNVAYANTWNADGGIETGRWVPAVPATGVNKLRMPAR